MQFLHREMLSQVTSRVGPPKMGTVQFKVDVGGLNDIPDPSSSQLRSGFNNISKKLFKVPEFWIR